MLFLVLFIHVTLSVVGVCYSAAPVFTTPGVPGRSIPVPETSPAGSSVYRVVAIDADQDRLIYSITSQVPPTPARFTITSTTGVVSTVSEFDADQLGAILEYQLSIRVTDGISSIETFLLMIIMDENDNSPEFSNFYVVREYQKPGMVIATVLAHDSDSEDNGNVRYYITGGTRAREFLIDSQSGVLYTLYGLQYDQGARFELVVEARDGGAEPRTSTTTLTVSLIESYENSATSPGRKSFGLVKLMMCFSCLFLLKAA